MYPTKQRYDPGKFPGKITYGPSLTVPDQTMSLREILSRHSRGLPISGVKVNPEYHGDTEDLVDFRTMDLAEKEDFIKAKADELKSIKDKLETERQQQQKKWTESFFKKPNSSEGAGSETPGN